MNKTDWHYFQCAKIVSALSDFERCKTGCIVVYKKGIISSGCNMQKTHPVQRKFNRFRFFKDDVDIVIHKTHAEIAALSKIQHMCINWKNVKLYVYRSLGKTREPGIARPCPACLNFIQSLGIKHIYYSTNSGFAHEELYYEEY